MRISTQGGSLTSCLFATRKHKMGRKGETMPTAAALEASRILRDESTFQWVVVLFSPWWSMSTPWRLSAEIGISFLPDWPSGHGLVQ